MCGFGSLAYRTALSPLTQGMPENKQSIHFLTRKKLNLDKQLGVMCCSYYQPEIWNCFSTLFPQAQCNFTSNFFSPSVVDIGYIKTKNNPLYSILVPIILRYELILEKIKLTHQNLAASFLQSVSRRRKSICL